MKLSLRTNITIPAWVAGVAAAVSVGCGVLALQLSRVLFTVIRESDYEAARMVTGVATAVQSDSTEILIPDEMYLEDEAKDVYSYGALQTILFRRTPAGVTDWQWSFNGVAWYNTDDTQADHATLLDPPNLIFICRLQLQSVARRKSASLKAKLLGQPNSHLGGRHIPPPLDTDDTTRDVFEAPDTLCCPISSCVMTQPVVAPSGKSFDYAALCEWVVRHGTDPTTNQALSLHDLYPNLVLREQVERWLAGEDLGFSPAAAAAAAAATGGAGADTAAGGGAAAVGGAGAGAAASGAALDAAAASDQGMPAGPPSESGLPTSSAAVLGPSAPAPAAPAAEPGAGAAGACPAAGAQRAVAAADVAAGEPVLAERTADTEAATSSSQAMTHDSSRSETLEPSGQEQQERQQGGATSSSSSSSSSSSVVEAAGGAGSGHQHQQAASSSSSSGSSGVCGGGVAVMPRPLGVSLEAPAGDGVAATTAAASSSQLASSSGGVNNTSMAELIPLGSTGGRRDVETLSPAGLAAVLQPLRHHLPAVSSSGSGAGVPSSSGSGILGQASSSSSSAGQLCSVRSSSSATSSSREWQRGPGLDSSSGCGGALLSVAQAPGVSAGAGYGTRHVQPALAGGLPVGLPTPAMLQATRLVQL